MPTTVTTTLLSRSATRRGFLQCSALAALAAAGGEILIVAGYVDQGGRGIIRSALDSGALASAARIALFSVTFEIQAFVAYFVSS